METKLWSNPLLVKTKEIKKVEITLAGEKKIDTSSVPLEVKIIEEKSASTK